MTWVALVQSLMDQHTKDSASISSNCLFTWWLPREAEASRKGSPWSCLSALWPPSGQQGSPCAERVMRWLQLSRQADAVKTHLCHWMTRTHCQHRRTRTLSLRLSTHAGGHLLGSKWRHYHHLHFKHDKTEDSGDKTLLKVTYSQ